MYSLNNSAAQNTEPVPPAADPSRLPGQGRVVPYDEALDVASLLHRVTALSIGDNDLLQGCTDTGAPMTVLLPISGSSGCVWFGHWVAPTFP